jgi:hypothetical protein
MQLCRDQLLMSGKGGTSIHRMAPMDFEANLDRGPKGDHGQMQSVDF